MIPGLAFQKDDDATMAIDFLMTFTLSLFFMLAITYAIKDNGLEQAKDLSYYEYELVASDVAMNAEDLIHSAERNPNIWLEKEIVLHHNVKTIECTINITNTRVRLSSQYEDIEVTRSIHNNGDIPLRGEIRSSSAFAFLVYDPDLKAIELRDYR